jgi:hypothetical protein
MQRRDGSRRHPLANYAGDSRSGARPAADTQEVALAADTIKSPDGTIEFKVGELVGVEDIFYGYKEARIVGVAHEGSWDPNAKDVDSIYIQMDDGFMVRPRIITKLGS